MPQADGMPQPPKGMSKWNGLRVGITGVRGSLGQAMARRFQEAGAEVTGLTHGTPPSHPEGPIKDWVNWSCGQEQQLKPSLCNLNILVLNHGINPQGDQSIDALDRALEVNALSTWRLLQICEQLAKNGTGPREVWINTSEAEIQPAVSPGYEVSKRLIGQLVSIRGAVRSERERSQLTLRKLVLGPFRSTLNPIGVMNADFVAGQILFQAGLGARLIVVTPNPLTFLLMPLSELGRRLYSRGLNRRDP